VLIVVKEIEILVVKEVLRECSIFELTFLEKERV